MIRVSIKLLCFGLVVKEAFSSKPLMETNLSDCQVPFEG